MNNYPMPAELRAESVAYLTQGPQELQNSHNLGRRLAVMGICAGSVIGFSLTRHDTEPVHAESPVITLAKARAVGMFDSFKLDGDDPTTTIVTTTQKATTTSEKASTTTEAATTTTEVELKFVKPDVIGEKACGPEINPEEVKMRHAAGEIVIKPSETNAFFDKYPQVEAGLDKFWLDAGNGDTSWMKFIADEKPVLNKDIIENRNDQGVRALKARMEAGVLVEDINVINHNCNVETGEIFANAGRNGHNNHLVKGDQVWTIELSKAEQQKMADLGIALPDSLITFPEAEGALMIIMERIACNNPLLEMPPPPPAETTTTLQPTTTTIETPTTLAPTTTTTTIPESTTTSSTSTTTTVPNSTTTSSTTTSTTSTTTTVPKGTVPPTTGCSEYNPCETTTTSTVPKTTTTTTVPKTTTTTSTPETTSTTTTTTVPKTTTTTSSIPGSTTTSSTTTTQPKGTVPPPICNEFDPCETTTTGN